MKILNIVINVKIKGDESDPMGLRSDLYEQLRDLMDEDDLEFEVEPSEDDEDEDYED